MAVVALNITSLALPRCHAAPRDKAKMVTTASQCIPIDGVEVLWAWMWSPFIISWCVLSWLERLRLSRRVSRVNATIHGNGCFHSPITVSALIEHDILVKMVKREAMMTNSQAAKVEFWLCQDLYRTTPIPIVAKGKQLPPMGRH